MKTVYQLYMSILLVAVSLTIVADENSSFSSSDSDFIQAPINKSCGTNNCGTCNGCSDQKICVPCIAPKPLSSSCPILCSTGCRPCGTTIFLPRSQGDNLAREMVDWNTEIFRYRPNQNYTCVDLAIEYTRSFKNCSLARSLFCTDCLRFQGSLLPTRNNQSDIVADYFGLAPDFKGALKIDPLIENYIIDFEVFMGLEEWFPGLFLWVNAPICNSRWNLRLNECQPCDNSITFTEQISVTPGFIPPGYMNSLQENLLTQTITPAPCIREALSGHFLFGDMQTPWKYGKFPFCARSDTRLADLDIRIGLNFIDMPTYNVAVYANIIIPTGNRPKAKYVFEPLVGNGKFYELGGGIWAHFNLLGDAYSSYQTMGLYLQANLTHIFKSHQRRSFDFQHNGLLSRYLLLKEFLDDGITYAHNLINAINYTTRNCEVSVDVKGEFAAMLCWRNDSWIADLGYNLYGRSREHVCIKTDCPCELDHRKFGIKGTEGVDALTWSISDGLEFEAATGATSLNSTQSTATLFSAGAVDNAQPVLPNPCLMTESQIAVTALSPQKAGINVCQSSVIQAQSSELPVLISCKDLDPNSAAQCKVLTNKIFGHIGYLWFDSAWEPHVGIGAEVEFHGNSPATHALTQWGIWLKGGLTF